MYTVYKCMQVPFTLLNARRNFNHELEYRENNEGRGGTGTDI